MVITIVSIEGNVDPAKPKGTVPTIKNNSVIEETDPLGLVINALK
jgi:hypothetical protein